LHLSKLQEQECGADTPLFALQAAAEESLGVLTLKVLTAPALSHFANLDSELNLKMIGATGLNLLSNSRESLGRQAHWTCGIC